MMIEKFPSPTGLTSREACAYALGMLQGGVPAPEIAQYLNARQDVSVSVMPEGGVWHACVVLTFAGGALEEYTGRGADTNGALYAALNVAAFPPTTEDALDALLRALDGTPMTVELEDAVAKARASLVRFQVHS